MAIDMRTVKSIEFNNKQVKRIEDSNGNVLWPAFKGVLATTRKIMSEIRFGSYMNRDPLYWTIAQLSSSLSSPSNSNSANNFYIFTENQILALLDDTFDFRGDGMYNNETIGWYEDGYFYLSEPGFSSSAYYICFIQSNKLYFVSNKTTNAATNNGLLGYTDDYTNAYNFTISTVGGTYGTTGVLVALASGANYIDNRNTLKYKSSPTAFIDYTIQYAEGYAAIPYQSITNPNANN